MSNPLRHTLFVVASIVTAIASTAALASDGDRFDTAKLPRVAGATETFASAPTTIFVSPETVAKTTEIARAALIAAGWQEYSDPFSTRAETSTMSIMSFKNGWRGLNVFITVAPAQRNATSVSYTAVAIANDLPFPKDAADIKFAPERPHLNLVTPQPLEAALAFYRKELGSLGWSLWSVKDGAKAASESGAGIVGEKAGRAFYVQDGRRPLLLTVQRRDDGRTGVELKAVPPALLTASDAKPRERASAPEASATRSAAQLEFTRSSGEFDRAADKIVSEILSATAEALGRPRPGAPKAGTTAPQSANNPVSTERIRASAGHDAPIPVPEQADEMQFNGANGRLEFGSASSVASLAAFYRSELRPLGWAERPSVINRPNMVVLNYVKAGKDLSLTIMQAGPKVRVTARGSGITVSPAMPARPAKSDAATGSASAAVRELEGEDKSGLPVPTARTSVSTEGSLFRVTLRAKVEADVASVLNFYRTQLANRDWKEDAKRAALTTTSANLIYASPEGPALLKLERDGDKTDVTLSLRKPDAAAKAGLMPKPGQVKLAFGNVTDGDAVVSIGRRTVKIGAGVGAKKPDGPSLELPPGKYKAVLKIAGKPDETEEIEVGADETWALLVGPGGILPLQVY